MNVVIVVPVMYLVKSKQLQIMRFFAWNDVGCCSFSFLIKIDDKSQQTFVLPDKWANGTQSYAPPRILLLSVVLKEYLLS